MASWRAFLQRFSRRASESQSISLEPEASEEPASLVDPEPLEQMAGRALAVVPTMAGFTWHQPGSGLPPGMPGDAWCLRDSISELFRWPVGGVEWRAFIEGPDPEDVSRLEQHLGLVHVDLRLPADVRWFSDNRAHPGIVILNIPSAQLTHAIYAPDLHRLPAIPGSYRALAPTVAGYLVDVRQPPR